MICAQAALNNSVTAVGINVDVNFRLGKRTIHTWISKESI
jgi:hypothetical protein